MMVCIFAAVFCFVIAFFLMAFTESLWSFLLPLAVGGAAAFFGINYSRLKKADLINDFRLCLQPGLLTWPRTWTPRRRSASGWTSPGRSKVSRSPSRTCLQDGSSR